MIRKYRARDAEDLVSITADLVTEGLRYNFSIPSDLLLNNFLLGDVYAIHFKNIYYLFTK